VPSASHRGAVAESMFCTWALSEGYDVYFPARGLSPSSDMIVDFEHGLHRVQVKRAHRRPRRQTTQLRANITKAKNQSYEPGEVDYFGFVDVDGGQIWLVPSFLLEGQTSIGLQGDKYDKYKVKGD
jgi:hypothetical protein